MSVVAGQDAKAAAQRQRFEESIARIRANGPRDGLERLILESVDARPAHPNRTSLTGPASANQKADL